LTITVDEAVRLGVSDEVKGQSVRRSVCFLLRPRFARGYEGQVALLLLLVVTLSRLPLVELLGRYRLLDNFDFANMRQRMYPTRVDYD